MILPIGILAASAALAYCLLHARKLDRSPRPERPIGKEI